VCDESKTSASIGSFSPATVDLRFAWKSISTLQGPTL